MNSMTTPAAESADLQMPTKGGASEQDWEILVTEGHVRGHRLVEVGKTLFPAALTCAALSIALAYASVTATTEIVAGLIPQPVVESFSVDPNSHTVVPGAGEKRVSYQMAWLGDITPVQGMTAEAYEALAVGAVNDAAQHGDEVSDWTAVPALDADPIITRPAKAFTDHAGKLGQGIVALPEDEKLGTVHVIAFVDGELTWTAYDRRRRACVVPFGKPPVPQCTSTPANNQIPMINAFQPKEASE